MHAVTLAVDILRPTIDHIYIRGSEKITQVEPVGAMKIGPCSLLTTYGSIQLFSQRINLRCRATATYEQRVLITLPAE